MPRPGKECHGRERERAVACDEARNYEREVRLIRAKNVQVNNHDRAQRDDSETRACDKREQPAPVRQFFVPLYWRATVADADTIEL